MQCVELNFLHLMNSSIQVKVKYGSMHSVAPVKTYLHLKCHGYIRNHVSAKLFDQEHKYTKFFRRDQRNGHVSEKGIHMLIKKSLLYFMAASALLKLKGAPITVHPLKYLSNFLL